MLLTWTGYPLDEAQWINEKNFTSSARFRKQMKQDRPVEETDKPQPSTSASLACVRKHFEVEVYKGGVIVVNAQYMAACSTGIR